MTKKILVIDDDPLVREMIVEILEEDGYEAEASLDFKDALQKVRQAPPDLVLIDAVMPEISGFDACRTIKETLNPHPPPVLLMTGNLKAIDPGYALKMGADDFAVKTSDMAYVVRAARNIFSSIQGCTRI
jgi:two-component system alkaline phosphatase synthesis response regulator PhoP